MMPDTWPHRTCASMILACAATILPLSPLLAGAAERGDFRDRFEIERTFEFNAESVHNRDLDDATSDFQSAVRPEIAVEIEFEASDRIRAFLELEANYRAFVARGRDRAPAQDEAEINVKGAYLDIAATRPGLSFRLGRQEFKDEREWLFDTDIDGISARVEHERLAFEFVAGRELLLKENLLERTPRQDKINNYAFIAHINPTDDHLLSAYTFIRDGRSGVDEDPVYFGVSARGDATDALSYWVDLAHLRGRDDGNRLRGVGLDIGATYRLPGRLAPSVTLGYAHASGDPEPTGGVDRQFRQSGLQDNSYRFNGVENFRYYGEALNPDLSNLRVISVGVGIRPTKGSSIDLTYHLYRQDVATAGRIPGARVIAETNGRDPAIGHGLNLIFGYHDIEDVRLRTKLGWFSPGAAFDLAGDAFVIESGIEVAF